MALDLDVRSEAGSVRGQVDGGFQGAGLWRRRGSRRQPAEPRSDSSRIRRSEATSPGTRKSIFEFPDTPAAAPLNERLRGTFAFSGPRVVACGLRRRERQGDRHARRPAHRIGRPRSAYGGDRDRPRLHPDAFGRQPGRVRPARQRPTASTCGTSRRQSAAPDGHDEPVVSQYHVRGQGRTVSGDGGVEASPRSRGRRSGHGTAVEFSVDPGAVSYTARGSDGESRRRAHRPRVRARRGRQTGIREPAERHFRREGQRATFASGRRHQDSSWRR